MAYPQAVIFDMDGTLVDTERVSQTAWRRAAADLNLAVPERIWHEFVGCSIPNARTMINAEFGDPTLTDKLFVHQRELFFELEDEELEPCLGALDALKTLFDAGMTLALATSTARDHASMLMDKFGMTPYFTSMTFGDEIEHSKPEPDIYLKAASRLNADPTQCAAVEDSINGVRASWRAGMSTYMVPEWVQVTPEVEDMCIAVLDSLEELPQTLLGIKHVQPPKQTKRHKAIRVSQKCVNDPFIRAENEDDDGYDPYSDRRPEPEPLFERDPWA